jgi:hypothetical protein
MIGYVSTDGQEDTMTGYACQFRPLVLRDAFAAHRSASDRVHHEASPLWDLAAGVLTDIFGFLGKGDGINGVFRNILAMA